METVETATLILLILGGSFDEESVQISELFGDFQEKLIW